MNALRNDLCNKGGQYNTKVLDICQKNKNKSNVNNLRCLSCDCEENFCIHEKITETQKQSIS